MILLFNSYTPNLFEKNQHFNSYCYKTVNFFCNLCLLVHMQDLIMTCKYSILSPQDLFSESGNLVCLSLIPMQPLSETVCPCFLPKPPQGWLTLGRLSQALTPTPLLKHCQPVLGTASSHKISSVSLLFPLKGTSILQTPKNGIFMHLCHYIFVSFISTILSPRLVPYLQTAFPSVIFSNSNFP